MSSFLICSDGLAQLKTNGVRHNLSMEKTADDGDEGLGTASVPDTGSEQPRIVGKADIYSEAVESSEGQLPELAENKYYQWQKYKIPYLFIFSCMFFHT